VLVAARGVIGGYRFPVYSTISTVAPQGAAEAPYRMLRVLRYAGAVNRSVILRSHLP
jgi:hypothetical protein